MSEPNRHGYPAAASGWMVGSPSRRVLDLGSGRGSFARLVAEDGHEVFCLDRRAEAVAALPEPLATGRHVAGRVEAMPFLSCHFDVVTAAQTLHHFAPGLALTEIARVLRPGGQLSVLYTTRDDTVPWVKRLMALMHQADPEAMRGDFGAESVDALEESPYFGPSQRRNFRNWLPVNRAGLLAMVGRRPSVAALDADARESLLADVGGLYDTSARAPEPLLLPFQTSCWRAQVDHSSLLIADDLDGAVHITI